MTNTLSTVKYNPNATHPKASNIKISPHAKQRALERFSISKESEIKKLAARAKMYGIKIWILNRESYQKLGLNRDTYRYLLNKYAQHYNTEKSFYYQDKVFVFAGQGSNILKSIVPCTQEDILLGCEKMEKDFKRYELDKVKERMED